MWVKQQWRRVRAQPVAVQVVWAVLLAEFCLAIVERQWPLAAIAAGAVALTLLPLYVTSRMQIQLPTVFLVGISLFIFATIWLGEAFDFYNRYWWWDIAMHGGSALGFGMLGFLFAFTLFEGDRFAAPAWALGLIAFSFAVTIGALWEIFEFAMDQLFGLNMQKSGLLDTMGDLIVDVIGAGVGALAGWAYLRGIAPGPARHVFEDFVQRNRRYFRKFRR